MSAQFTLCAIDCGTFGGLPSEHTYIGTSDNQNFNCFGRNSGGRTVRTSTGSSKWASLIYGAYQGCGDDQPAVGLRVRYDGVCQNACNRLLVLTGDAIDARATKGNVLATLMYGVFGFNIDKYVAAVKSAGAQLLQSNPGEIQPSDIQTVLNRIALGQSPDAELDILHADIPEQEGLPALPPITDAQRAAFRPIYSDYQSERQAAFLATASKVPYGTQIAYKELPLALVQPLEKCVERLIEAVGPAQFASMFGITPDALKAKLAGFQ